jgi:hypothetical protein
LVDVADVTGRHCTVEGDGDGVLVSDVSNAVIPK